MKKIFKKNQIIITALALMIAVAGYINYSDYVKRKDKANNEKAKQVAKELPSEEESKDINVDSPLDDPGATVLTSTRNSQFILNAKLKREQVRAQDKETLLTVINNADISEEDKKTAVAGMSVIADNSEKELAAELLLEAKGFSNAIVSIGAGSVDVVVESAGLSDTDKAQIEDVVTRKTNCKIEELTITTVAPIVESTRNVNSVPENESKPKETKEALEESEKEIPSEKTTNDCN